MANALQQDWRIGKAAELFDFVIPDPPESTDFYGPGALVSGGNHGLRLDKILEMPKCSPYSIKETWSKEHGGQIEVGYYVPWTARKKWLNYMLGYSYLVVSEDPENPDSELRRVIPFQAPEAQYEHLYCVDIRPGSQNAGALCQTPYAKAHDGAGKPLFPDIFPPRAPVVSWPMYLENAQHPSKDENGNIIAVYREGWADYVAVFRQLPYRVRTDDELDKMIGNKGELERYVVRSSKQAIQSQPLPKGSIVWTDGPNAGQTIPENAAFVLVPTAEISWSWEELPSIPTGGFQVQGKINSGPFDGARGAIGPNGIGTPWPTRTLLAQAPQFEELTNSITGQIFFRAKYTALYREAGWDKLLDSSGQYHGVALIRGGQVNLKNAAVVAALNTINNAVKNANFSGFSQAQILADATAAVIAGGGLFLVIALLTVETRAAVDAVNAAGVLAVKAAINAAVTAGKGTFAKQALYQEVDFNQLFDPPPPASFQ